MPRDFTAETRDRLLREHQAGHPDEAGPAPARFHGPEGGYTAKLARELRARHDGDDHDAGWIAANAGTPNIPGIRDNTDRQLGDTMHTGMRGTQPVHPGNPTGALYRKQRADAERQKKIRENPDEFINRARQEGWSAGYDAGLERGLDLAAESLLALSGADLLAKRAEYQATFADAPDDQADEGQAHG